VKPLPLTAETLAVLSRIRDYGWTLSVHGMSHGRTMRLVKARTERRINNAGTALQDINTYRRYVHEMVKAFRTETGERLAQAVELAIRKWSNLGLEPGLLQALLNDVFLRFEQYGYAVVEARPATTPKRRGQRARGRRSRTYGDALKRGRVALCRGGTVEEQVARQREGAALAAVVAEKLRPVLASRRTPGRRFVAYYNFAQKLGRLTRNYSGRSLQIAACDLVDLFEAKSLDGDTLRSIAADVFGINATL
jgi:hypothetical protein